MHAAAHALDRSWCGEPARPAAACQTHEHRFGNVVLVVPEPERPGPDPVHPLSKERETRRPRLFFACGRRDPLPATDAQPHTERGAHAPAESLVGASRAPAQTMVEMQGHQLTPPASTTAFASSRERRCARTAPPPRRRKTPRPTCRGSRPPGLQSMP